MANKSHLSAHLKLPDYQSALSPYVRKLILENTYSAHQDTKVLNKDGLIDFSYICSKLDGKYRTKRIRGCFVDKKKYHFHDITLWKWLHQRATCTK